MDSLVGIKVLASFNEDSNTVLAHIERPPKYMDLTASLQMVCLVYNGCSVVPFIYIFSKSHFPRVVLN